ncbi:hypothetical protein [Flavobacterium beibuense]|uniref:hypothetical protein n=1 Tax=Flavobacterium beibuense TaxID=657326 RepID=UPI003A8D74B9
MERIKTFLPTLLILLIFAGCLVWYFDKKNTVLKNRIERERIFIKQKDSLRKEIDSLQVLINVRAKEIDSLKRIYPELENKLIIIKAHKDEKIRAVDSYTRTEFEEFFSNRYPEK